MNEFEQPRNRWNDGQPDRFAKIIRFELTTALARSGSATAKRLDWDGTELEANDLTFSVYDVFGRYAAAIGRQGWAVFSHDSARWEIINLAAYVMIRGLLKTAMTTGDATHTIDNVVVMQGVDPRTDPASTAEEITFTNLHEWEGDDNATAVLVWNETNAVWEAIQVTCPA